MKKLAKIVSVISVIAMLITSFAIVPSSAYDTPVEPDLWIDPNFSTDHAYSFAFVGDTQYLSCGDYYLGTNKLYQQYKYIADTADERKLEHVFILGDITDLGYKNDGNLAGAYYTTPLTTEWENAKKAIGLLDGVVSYNITRGNHDDYMIDDYFNKAPYTTQFSGCGGFYSDSNAKWTDISGVTKSREADNPNAYVYWSAKTGYHSTSMVNSYKTMNIGGTNYLFITVDFNPTTNVLNWVNSTLAAYPNHKAIITTHSYLSGNGEVTTSDDGCTMYLFGNTPNVLWDKVLSKHENVFMVVSGHTGGVNPTISYNKGVNGNQVIQVLVDPQAYDAKEIDKNGTIEHGTQDTGLILYMNFSKDGKTINFDYYSPLFGKFLKYNNHTIYLEKDENANNKDTNLAAMEEYGQINTYLFNNTKLTPSLNGTIAANEYSVVRTTEANANNNFEGTLTEYFAHDDNYVYYAFTTKQTKTNQWMQLNIKPNYDWIDKSEISTHHYLRSKINFLISDAGVVSGPSFENVIPPSCVDNSPNVSTARANKDVFVSGSRNSTTLVNTFEFKISKEYLAINTPEKELECLAYMLYLGTNESDAQMWHRWENGTAASKVMGSSGYWMYEYIIFTDQTILSTAETASVRLVGDGHNGLRFKTMIDADLLQGYVNKFGSANVQVGTLIAPTDTLDGKKLTHSIGTDGIDYIDVVAKVDAPFDTDGEVNIYAGSITNVSESNIERDFTAVGYIKYVENGETKYIYSGTSAQRNIDYIAFEAFGDVSNTYKLGYIYLVSKESDAMYGKYSPYSASQRAILVGLMADKSLSDPFASDPYK